MKHEIILKFKYRDLNIKELEMLLFELQGLAKGKIYSISEIKEKDLK